MVVRSPSLSINTTARQVAYLVDTIGYGGLEIFTLLLIKHLDPQRYTPVVIVPGSTGPRQTSPTRFIDQVQEIGVPLIRLPVRSEIPALGFITQIQKTRRIFKDNQFDVVHIHTSRPLTAQISTISARISGVSALVRTEHLPPVDVDMDMTTKTRFAVKLQDWMTDYILTVSDANLEDQVKIMHRNRKKLYRSYGGIELDKFSPEQNTREAKRKIGLDPDLPVVGSVGRLAPEKGHAYLIQAASHIINEFGPVNFLVIGEGPLEQQLRQQVEDLALHQYFHFAGYKQEVNLFMKSMDIGVTPSLREGFPLVLLEFMATGIPTVTSCLPCFREAIVDGESGLITQLDKENSLADNILKLLRDPDMAARMGQKALERVSSQFSVQRLAADMMDFYDKLLVSKKNRLLSGKAQITSD